MVSHPLFKFVEDMSDSVESQSDIRITESLDSDGRLESIDHEDVIVDHIFERFDEVIRKTGNRGFGDFYIDGRSFDITQDKVPVNVKVTTGSGDNAFSTRHINYVLFDGGRASKINLAKKIKNGEFCSSASDYYYLVYIKNKDLCFAGSLLTVNEESVYMNPSNMGQITWNSYNPAERTKLNGQKYVAELYKEWAKKVAKPYNILTDNE